jgi:hypothetical protein
LASAASGKGARQRRATRRSASTAILCGSTSSTPQPNSQIEIAGFTSLEEAGGHEVIRVSMESASLVLPDFTIIVLLVLGGTMAGISGFVLVKTRK